MTKNITYAREITDLLTATVTQDVMLDCYYLQLQFEFRRELTFVNLKQSILHD